MKIGQLRGNGESNIYPISLKMHPKITNVLALKGKIRESILTNLTIQAITNHRHIKQSELCQSYVSILWTFLQYFTIHFYCIFLYFSIFLQYTFTVFCNTIFYNVLHTIFTVFYNTIFTVFLIHSHIIFQYFKKKYFSILWILPIIYFIFQISSQISNCWPDFFLFHFMNKINSERSCSEILPTSIRQVTSEE